MTVKRRDFQKIATTIHQFLLKLTDTSECAELRDSLNMSLLQLQKYYRKCQQRLQHTGRYNNDQNGTGYVSPRQSLRITLSRTSEALSPMTPYIEEPQYFHATWTVLDEKADQIRKSISQENLSPQRSLNTPPIHYAATKADFELLNDLYREKKDVLDDQDCLGRTPLMYAVYYNQINVVRWLLERGADPNACDLSEITSLHWACFKGNVSLIELLLDAGANINYQDSFGRSATHWACTFSNVEPLQMLIEFETKINQHDRNGLTPAMWACRLDHISHLNILSNVKNQEIDHIDGFERDRNGRTIIHWSIRRQQPLECLKHLLNDQTIQLKDDEGKTVMLLAAEQGALETCKVIVERFGSKFIEDVDDNDRTCLILATSGGHGEVVNYLLENGSNLKARDKTGATCVDIARNQYLFYCQLIISSHIRELERRNESIPSDCVELIERATSRHNSISEARSLVKTPPRPPTSPKSQSLKRRMIKHNRDQSIDNDEEMPNGFDAMSSDSYKFNFKNPEKNDDHFNQSVIQKETLNDENNLSKSLENLQYHKAETLDYLDNDTGQQYHGSYEFLQSNKQDASPKSDNFSPDQTTLTEQNPNLRPFQRAKQFNRISSNAINKTTNISHSENLPKSHDVDELPPDIHTSNSSTKHNRPISNSNIESPPKINYGASLEPIAKHFSVEPVVKKKKKRTKEQRLAAKSHDRLENLNYNKEKQFQNLESLSHAKSLENVSNKSFQLPNGIVSKRLLSTSEINPRGIQAVQNNRNYSPLTGEIRMNEHDNLPVKLSGKKIPSLDPVSSNNLKNRAARF